MSDDYEVGYGKPPKANQFQKGQSGNPAGRKKGSKNVSTLIREALDEKVDVVANGKKRRMSKLEAAFTQQANKAAAGDIKATSLMVELLGRGEGLDGSAAARGISNEERRKANARVFAAMKAQLPGNGGPKDEH